MKTAKFIFFFLATLLCLSACEKEDNPKEPAKPEEVKSEISIDANIITNGLSFSNTAGEQSISFTTNNDWTLSIATIQSGDVWCTASETSGTKGNANVKFAVTENTSYDDRSVSVTIKSGTVAKTFTIYQKAVDALLITTNKYELSQNGGTIEIEVKANIDYEMEIAENAKDWVTEAKTRALTAYKHTLTIATNEEVEKREGEIYFKSGDKIETVKIYQEGAGAIIVLSQKEYTVSDAGETISVDIRSNVEYGVQMPDVDWITDSPDTRGMSSHTLKYTIAPNEGYDSRSADIIFYDMNSELKDTLKVVQAQKDAIVISKKAYEVDADGETIEVKLSANVEFEITMPEVDWIEMVSTRTLQNHTLYFKVAENLTISNRTANIVFSNKESKLSDTISIKQLSSLGNHKFYSDSKGLYGIVELYRAGVLKNVLDLYKKLEGDTHLTNLTISGPINGDDIKVLNQVYSSNSNFEIDLSDAIIIEGGSSYYENYYTKNNEIGNCMFTESKAKIINLPKSASTIEGYAFNNSNLITIKTGDGITTIKDYAFSNANKLRNIYIGEGVTKLQSRAFSECPSLMVLDISIGVPSIADYAFKSIPVTNVHISNDVTAIGKESFAYCRNLKTVTIGDGVTKIGESAFDNCDALNSITMGKSVVSIGDFAFDCCSLLTSIDIPNSVKEIGKYAFSGTALSYIDIPNGLTKIGNYAFSSTSLIYAVLPSSLADIGDYTFKDCPKFTRLYCNATVPPAGYNMLDSDVHVYVPYQSVEAYKASDNWKTYANHIVGYDCEQDEIGLDLSKCKVGDFINYKGVNCVVFYAENDAVKLISATIKNSCEWGLSGQSIGAYDTKDGSANAAKAKSKGLFDSLPAFVWCESLGDGWYLPSNGELSQLAKNRYSVEVALENMNCTPLMGKQYWSSTEPDGTGKYAYSVDFSYNSDNVAQYHSSKNSGMSVRAVMSIKK